MKQGLVLSLLGLWISALPADAQAPENSPRPNPRPEVEAAVPQQDTETAGDDSLMSSIRPRQRSGSAEDQDTVPAEPQTTADRAGALCGMPGIEGREVAPVTSEVEGCGVEEPVRVRAVDGVRLSQTAVLDCPTARALTDWVRRGVKPAIGDAGGGVAQLQVAGHYVCRPRNNREGAEVSEHGRGKAIDISGLTLADGETISVLEDWRSRREGRMLKQMHAVACEIFGTTLGPGSDGYHQDHLHYDTATRRRAYCR